MSCTDKLEQHTTHRPAHDEIYRTTEIEESTNRYFIHPLSRRLVVHFARWGWSPNTVSMLGMTSALGAAICLYHYHNPGAVVAGFMLLICWHVFDGADGQLARLTGKASDLGKFIDGLCDHVGVAAVYISLSMAMSGELGQWIWLVTVGAGISHIVQAGAFEYQRDMYDCWVHAKSGKCVPPLEALAQTDDSNSSWHGLAHRPYMGYVRMQYRVAAVDPRLSTIRQELDHQSMPAAAATYRRINQPAVLKWSWLSANKRTLALSVLCLLQVPLLFFLLELTFLNVLLWWLQRQQAALNSELVSELQSQTAL